MKGCYEHLRESKRAHSMGGNRGEREVATRITANIAKEYEKACLGVGDDQGVWLCGGLKGKLKFSEKSPYNLTENDRKPPSEDLGVPHDPPMTEGEVAYVERA